MAVNWQKLGEGALKILDGVLNPVTQLKAAQDFVNDLSKEGGAIDQVQETMDMVHDDSIQDVGMAFEMGKSLAPIQPGAIGSMLGLSATESTSSEEAGSSWDAVVILIGVVVVAGVGILLYRWWGS